MQITQVNQNQNFGINMSRNIAKNLVTLRRKVINTGNEQAIALFEKRMKRLQEVCPDMRLEYWNGYVCAINKENNHAEIVSNKPLTQYFIRLKQILKKLEELEKKGL